jgi:hypothetical protein
LFAACAAIIDMAALQGPDVLGQAIVGFSRDGMFPEEDEVSAMKVESSALPAALSALAAARADLEVSCGGLPLFKPEYTLSNLFGSFSIYDAQMADANC